MFTLATFEFLAELGLNNERAWFDAHRDRYERDVREPARAFVRAMRPRLEALSPHFLADDKKVGGAVMRQHRDTRFSADKRPYKTHVGIQFRHAQGKDIHAPGFYVHVGPDELFLGVGLWRPPSDALAKIRAHIDAEQAAWRAIVAAPAPTAAYRQGGESLKRAPRGYANDHPLVDELKRTSFILIADLDADTVIGPGFVDHVAGRFATAAPYMRTLCAALDAPF